MNHYNLKSLLALSIYLMSLGIINAQENTVESRIQPPQNYVRQPLESDSFGYFLRNIELLAEGSPVLDFNGDKIYNQSDHIGVLNYDVGKRDLQQCADAVIRIRAEYLWKQKRYDEIGFHFTSGDNYSWNDHKNGLRPVVKGNKVSFVQKASKDGSYANFRKYLNYIYMYAGTISINQEMTKVKRSEDIKIGDVIVTPGSPGHAVIIIDEAINNEGRKVYLIAQGFTPAQSIHIIKNNAQKSLNNWYKLEVGQVTSTVGYDFYDTNVRRFRSVEE